jgi:hypothetical protein
VGEFRGVLRGNSHDSLGKGNACVSRGKVRIECNGLAIGDERPLDVLEIASAPVLPCEQVLIVGFGIVAAMGIESHRRQEFKFQR